MHTLAFALTLVLRTYDMVGVPPGELAHAKQAVADVMARAHIELSWIVCQAAVGARDPLCNDTPQRSELIVRITSSPGHRTSDALADAYVDGGTTAGVLATVYVDRVRTLAAASGVDAGTLMGRAIAHEVGHLLSGSPVHSASGVMRAVWSAPAIRRDSPRAWTFSGREAEQLRQNLSERVEGTSGRQAALVEPVTSPRPCTKAFALTCAQTR